LSYLKWSHLTGYSMIHDRDSVKTSLLVEKYKGRKGAEWESFRDAFIDANYGRGDEDASISETLLGTDPRSVSHLPVFEWYIPLFD
jgi:hypothetical protein